MNLTTILEKTYVEIRGDESEYSKCMTIIDQENVLL